MLITVNQNKIEAITTCTLLTNIDPLVLQLHGARLTDGRMVSNIFFSIICCVVPNSSANNRDFRDEKWPFLKDRQLLGWSRGFLFSEVTAATSSKPEWNRLESWHLCASARNILLRSIDHVCNSKKHPTASHQPCAEVQETSYGVASTMCASARNVIIPTTTTPLHKKHQLIA